MKSLRDDLRLLADRWRTIGGRGGGYTAGRRDARQACADELADLLAEHAEPSRSAGVEHDATIGPCACGAWH